MNLHLFKAAGLALGVSTMIGPAVVAQSTGAGPVYSSDYAPQPAFPRQTKAPPPAQPSAIEVQVVAGGLENPWSLAFLPDGRLLLTERVGRLRIVERDGRLSPPLAGVPAVRVIGTKGLHDVSLHPDFARNRLVYLTYFAPNPARPPNEPARVYPEWVGTPPTEREANKVGFETVGRGRLSADGTRLEDFQLILRAPSMGARRLVWARDGTLFVSADTPASGALATDSEPQRLDNLYGKVLRINPDGSIPRDNPFRNRAGVRPEIYAYGFRDPEGAALDPRTGRLWTAENGPRGGDEINEIRPGRNYGFPTVSYGLDYQWRRLGTGELAAPGIEQPIYFWTPSIALSGMAIYRGRLFPEWRGDILVGALLGQRLVRLDMEKGEVRHEEALLADRKKRIRDVREAPDGSVYVLTDENPGEVLRLVPRRD